MSNANDRGVESGPSAGVSAGAEQREEATRVSPLRGASVRVDGRRVKQIAVALALVTLAVLSITLSIAGVNRNSQVIELHTQGVKVALSVSGCQGLLGGSGSNAAGYVCRANFALDGHHYNEVIPGNTFYVPGTHLAGVAVPDNPGLVATVAQVNAEQTSSHVYILPSVFAALFLLGLGLIANQRRRVRRRDGAAA